MTPLKIFLNLKDRLLAEEALTDIQPDDPLQHPEVRSMNLRQLADLPFPGHFHPAAHHEKPLLAKCA